MSTINSYWISRNMLGKMGRYSMKINIYFYNLGLRSKELKNLHDLLTGRGYAPREGFVIVKSGEYEVTFRGNAIVLNGIARPVWAYTRTQTNEAGHYTLDVRPADDYAGLEEYMNDPARREESLEEARDFIIRTSGGTSYTVRADWASTADYTISS
jgi:hypothetical protein